MIHKRNIHMGFRHCYVSHIFQMSCMFLFSHLIFSQIIYIYFFTTWCIHFHITFSHVLHMVSLFTISFMSHFLMWFYMIHLCSHNQPPPHTHTHDFFTVYFIFTFFICGVCGFNFSKVILLHVWSHFSHDVTYSLEFTCIVMHSEMHLHRCFTCEKRMITWICMWFFRKGCLLSAHIQPELAISI